MFEKHKESVEIAPGIFLDQKEARGYLLSIILGRGLLPTARLAHDIGVQIADAVRRVEKDAQRDTQAAKKKAGRKGAAVGSGGAREIAGKHAAWLAWSWQRRLDLAEKNVRVLERALRKAGVDVEEVDYATHSDSLGQNAVAL